MAKGHKGQTGLWTKEHMGQTGLWTYKGIHVTNMTMDIHRNTWDKHKYEHIKEHMGQKGL